MSRKTWEYFTAFRSDKYPYRYNGWNHSDTHEHAAEKDYGDLMDFAGAKGWELVSAFGKSKTLEFLDDGLPETLIFKREIT